MSHFSIKELIHSDVAIQKGINNIPNEEEMSSLLYLIGRLEEVRTTLNDNVMRVSSGFRCKVLNKAVGGVDSSAHTKGLAVDFTCVGYGNTVRVVEAIYKSNIQYDQLILEYPNKESSWVHIGFASKEYKPRRQTLITTTGVYKEYTP